ncbi:unnamed protein product [Camellia sinensis]
MHPNTDRIPVAKGTLRDYKVVFDAVYMPRKTTLLKEAEAAGAIIVSGVEMFLRQAIEQFNLFTGGKGNLRIQQSSRRELLYSCCYRFCSCMFPLHNFEMLVIDNF